MAMVACPGCGLPREADRIGDVPCPVCVSDPVVEPIAAALPSSALPDPIAGLPADISQMEAVSTLERRSPLAVFCAFLIGIATGAGGLLAWQQEWLREEKDAESSPLLTDAPGIGRSTSPLPAVAPMPHVPRYASTATGNRTGSEIGPRAVEKPALEAPAVARRVIVPLNQPDAAYTIPRPLERGEHLILRGKVRMFRVNGLGPGAVLDASALEAGSIYVGGTIEGGSILRINCPDGVVEVPAAVCGRSRLEIDAPGSSVRFLHPSAPGRPGSRIDGGSSVIIKGRTVDLRGDVAGAETSVRVTLTRNGSLKVAAVRGSAVVEYRSEEHPASEPSAQAATVEPGAAFRKLTP